MATWRRFLRRQWRLRGFDAFAGDFYPVGRTYWTEKGAQRAARRLLREIEAMQPSATSGGQEPGAIQDRVYIVRPDGAAYRFLPGDED
jgi:hypothetical protein